MKTLKLIALFVLIYNPLFSQLTGYYDDFEDGSLDTTWNAATYTLWMAGHPDVYGLSENDGILSIAYVRTAESYIWSNYNFTPPENIDVSNNPLITLKIKSDVAHTLTFKPIYSNANDGWLHNEIPADNEWHVYSYQLAESNYTGGYLEKIYIYIDAGSSEIKSGTVQFDDFQIGGFSIPVNNLQALLIDSSKIDLTWESVDPENTDHFNIYRSLDGGFIPGETFKIAEATDLIYHDSGLTNNTTYYYQVSATDLDAKEHGTSGVSIRTFTPGAVPSIEIVSENANPVASYEKYELVINMTDASYSNPYNPEEIDLYAWFYAPDGDSVRMNGFYDDYMGQEQWKIRFAANQTGSWEYRVFATDMDGTGSIEKRSFTVSESANKGWLHISPDNPNYLMHDDGSSFYGISVYYPWAVSQTGLDNFAEVSGNLFGYWDCTFDGEGNGGGRYLLESMDSGVGKYDQRKAARIDEVLSWAEAREMKVMLAVWTHPYLRIDNVPWNDGYWHEQNPYSSLVEVRDFYTDSLALSYQEKHHRYMIARWGYSQALGIWEIINEIHGTSGWVESQADSKEWVENVHSYFKNNDPFQRPTTASFGGSSGASHYSLTDLLGDMPNIHFYEQHGWPTLYPDNLVRSGLANVVSEARKLKSKGARPAFFGEAGYYTMLNDVDTEAYTWELHNSFWAGLTNGLATTPFWWNFTLSDILTPLRLAQYKSLNTFVSDIDFAHQVYVPTDILADNADGYYMGAATNGFGWMTSYEDISLADTPVLIPGLELNNGTYLLEWFNTWTGESIDSDTAFFLESDSWGNMTRGMGGEDLAFHVPGEIDEKDIAFKFGRLEDGEPASEVRLFLIESDTLLTGQDPWSPNVDSVNYRIAVYVSDLENRMDVSYNGSVDVDIEEDGHTDSSSRDLLEGGTIFEYKKIGSTWATITCTVEGVGNAELHIDGISGIIPNEVQSSRGEFQLGDNYPNPFDQSTTIEYVLAESAHIKLAMFDAQGKLLEILVDNKRSAGHHSIVWNANNYPAGIYFYTLGSEHLSKTKKCVLLK